MFVVAAGLRLWGINFGLPALYRPDEDVTVGRAMGILHGILDPHFADWPHLYFYLAAAWLAPFRLVGLVSDPASGYLGVRILDALLGSLTVLLAFEFGRRAYGWLAGFFGAAALSVAFLVMVAFIVFGVFFFRIRERFESLDVRHLDLVSETER